MILDGTLIESDRPAGVRGTGRTLNLTLENPLKSGKFMHGKDEVPGSDNVRREAKHASRPQKGILPRLSGAELQRPATPGVAVAIQRLAGNAAMTAWLAGSTSDTPDPKAVQRAASETLPEGWTGEGGLSLTREDSEKADEFLRNARENEARISTNLKSMADKVNGVKFIGWEYKLKGEDSLKRKLASVLRDSPMLTTDEALRDIRDSVRYTIELTDEIYVNGAEEAMGWLRENGFEAVAVRNTWGNKRGYKGINSNWRDVSTGHVFELQFHTPHSFGAKMATHHLYEEARLFPPGKERDQATAKMGDVYAEVPVPSGAPQVGSTVRSGLE
ncbi:ATP nucleotide 3'-pyrophosphokinase [Streptomyces sp. NPDC002143]